MSDSSGPAAISLERRKSVVMQIPCFAELPPKLVDELASRLREKAFAAGSAVVSEGEVGDQLFLIESGVAEATTKGPAGPVSLALLGAGDMFGEIALLNHNRRRQATVTAKEPLQALTLSAADFENAMAAFPELRVDVVIAAEAMLHTKFLKRKAGSS